MSENILQNDADSTRKCREAEALLSDLTRLQAEMLRIKVQMDSLQGCPPEIVVQVDLNGTDRKTFMGCDVVGMLP